MTVSTRVFKTFSGRRRHTVDPARHFAIRIMDGGAAPVSHEQFLDVTHRVAATASLLKKLAAATVRDAKAASGKGDVDEGLPIAIREKLAYAERMQSEFESYLKQLMFNDQSAFQVIERTRTAMTEAIGQMHVALRSFESHGETSVQLSAPTPVTA